MGKKKNKKSEYKWDGLHIINIYAACDNDDDDDDEPQEVIKILTTCYYHFLAELRGTRYHNIHNVNKVTYTT